MRTVVSGNNNSSGNIGGKEEGEAKKCVNCSNSIDQLSLSFEQKLIDDEDFCRRCWDDIMNGSYDEQAVVMPKLK